MARPLSLVDRSNAVFLKGKIYLKNTTVEQKEQQTNIT
jgi:hypothetical protein